MTLNSLESLREVVCYGIYSTKIKTPDNNLWSTTNEQTMADFAGMQAGDNIYFFHKRKIYGIGELVDVNGSCIHLNFPEANEPYQIGFHSIKNEKLTPDGNWTKGESESRWVCTFAPAPYFFKDGIDMDAALQSNPSAFKMLRAFQQLSFVKVDDEENQALKDIILKKNEEHLDGSPTQKIYKDNIDSYHHFIKEKTSSGDYQFDIQRVMENSIKGNAIKFRREVTLELALMHKLNTAEENVARIFGQWDYISRQVIASPFKPISWMDKIDIFGYKYIKNYRPTLSKYLVCELKKDSANISDVNQLMKYIDWVNNEYTFGDYSMIDAFIVAHNFPENVIDYVREKGKRIYTTKLRDDRFSEEWNNIRLVTYRYDSEIKDIVFGELKMK
ncbi:hypothetical protein [Thalassobacillus devorans]|uniref:hypothetical protein n=1 Tax=Thalassobacillus devorans TaxID=279813 RepID=UPI000A1CA14C|nr:hypothetical protein [Thalassobacillus devorans]